MSFENPTRLRVGMHGNFAGKDYRLVGRVVMGETEGGETYYWNEFNLESPDGSSADLVFEETERGGEWRLFTMFEPEYPITAVDAATKLVGDRINLTGEDVRITLRSKSRVFHIEGKAPEGVEVGDVADYFNAQAGNDMQVVSWTGEEVECYNGINLPQNVVAVAFNLPRASDASQFSGGGSSWLGGNAEHYDSAAKFFLKAAVLIFLFIIILGRDFSCSTNYASAPVKKIPAGAPPLTVGAAGRLLDRNYRVSGRAFVEIAEVGACFERHEYQLADDNGQIALLVCGMKPGGKNWTLFTPLTPLLPPSAKECAAQKIGDAVNVDAVVGNVREIFLSTLRQTEGTIRGEWSGSSVRFGYLAQSDYNHLLVRWNNSGISFQRGMNIPAGTVTAAFSEKTPR